MMVSKSEVIQLRPAVEQDEGAIREIVRRAGINPFGLDWPRFTVAENLQGRVVACGQLKRHKDGSLELGSLAVREEWRGKGIGSRLVEALKAQVEEDLWLMCRSSLVDFYRQHGFDEVPLESEQPPYFARVRRLADAFHWLRGTGEYLAVMVRPHPAAIVESD